MTFYFPATSNTTTTGDSHKNDRYSRRVAWWPCEMIGKGAKERTEKKEKKKRAKLTILLSLYEDDDFKDEII